MIKLINLQYKTLNSILSFFKKIFFKSEYEKINKVLIFRNGSFGDTICALPAIENIKINFPNASIDILTNAGSSNLVSIENIIDSSLINKFINYLELDKKELVRLIKNEKYDLFIELPQDQATFFSQLRNIFVVKFIFNIKNAFGWEIGATKFQKKIQEKKYKFLDERTRLLNILERNNLKNKNFCFPLNISSLDKELVLELLTKNNIKDKSKNIAFVVGAKRYSNRWPISYFKEVAIYLRKLDYNILIIGGNDDKELAMEFLNISNVYDFTGSLTPMQSAELFKYCNLTISNDTGPMHLSYSVDTPVISIFSARDYPFKWFPPEGNDVLRNNSIDCSVCFTETCTDNKCMKLILPEIVIEKIEKRLILSENLL